MSNEDKKKQSTNRYGLTPGFKTWLVILLVCALIGFVIYVNMISDGDGGTIGVWDFVVMFLVGTIAAFCIMFL